MADEQRMTTPDQGFLLDGLCQLIIRILVSYTFSQQGF